MSPFQRRVEAGFSTLRSVVSSPSSASPSERGSSKPTSCALLASGPVAGDLPADTLGVFAVTGLDESLRTAWPELDKNAKSILGDDWQEGLDSFTNETGVSVPDDLAKAALEAVCYQTADLLHAMRRDWPAASDTVLRVDGGMVASDWTMQRLADLLDAPVDRPTVLETTALGAAWLAGRHCGVWPDMEGFAERWNLDRRFEPAMDQATRTRKWAGWQDAVRRTLTPQQR